MFIIGQRRLCCQCEELKALHPIRSVNSREPAPWISKLRAEDAMRNINCWFCSEIHLYMESNGCDRRVFATNKSADATATATVTLCVDTGSMTRGLGMLKEPSDRASTR